MKQLLFFTVFFAAIIVGFAQTGYDSIPKFFFQVFEQKGSDAAIDYIYATNKYISGNIAANLKVKSELKKIVSLIGKYRGHELISEKFIGKSYVQMSFLAKFDRQPLKFTFILYKPDKVWQLQKLQFDDKVAEGFDE